MPELKDLYGALLFLDSIIDHDWTVDQLSHVRSFCDRLAHSRKAAEQVHVIEQRATESPSCLGVVVSYMADEFSQVV